MNWNRLKGRGLVGEKSRKERRVSIYRRFIVLYTVTYDEYLAKLYTD